MNENDHSYVSDAREPNVYEEFVHNFPDDQEECNLELQLKTISMQEYKHLKQMIPQVQRLQNTIKIMADKIKSKDKQLNTIEIAHRRALKKYSDTSHLSAVSSSSVAFLHEPIL